MNISTYFFFWMSSILWISRLSWEIIILCVCIIQFVNTVGWFIGSTTSKNKNSIFKWRHQLLLISTCFLKKKMQQYQYPKICIEPATCCERHVSINACNRPVLRIGALPSSVYFCTAIYSQCVRCRNPKDIHGYIIYYLLFILILRSQLAWRNTCHLNTYNHTNIILL